MKAERHYAKTKEEDTKQEEPQPMYIEFEGEGDSIYQEINEAEEPQGTLVGIFRINSKTVYV